MKKREKVVVEIPLTHAMELYHRGYAQISTGEIKLTPAGRKQLGKSAVRVRLVIAGTVKPPT